MALPTWYDTGTVSVTNGSASVAGTGTLWGGDAIMAGDLFCDLAQPLVPPQRIASVEANGALMLAAPWPGTSLTDDAYEIRYVGIIERSTAQTRRVLEQLGEVSAYFDVQVDDTAARLALESVDAPLRANYRVLVSDIGDGTAAIYSKASSAYNDWTAPAPYSGPVGPTGPQGPEGVAWQGDYSGATAYVLDDAVLYNGSSWRALGATTGNAPPTLPTTSNAYWQLLARQGIDGAGTVSSVVAGEGIAVDNTDPTAPVISATVDALTMFALAQMETAELADYPIMGPGSPTGNGVIDGFNILDAVDLAGSSGVDSSEVGVLKPLATVAVVTSATPSVPQGPFSNATFIDRGVVCTNGRTIRKIGVFSDNAASIPVRIFQYNGSASYTRVYAEAFAHPGGGWAYCTLATPYVVPGSGTFHPGCYAAGPLTIDCNSVNRASFIGDASGTQTFTESGASNTPGLRVEELTGALSDVSVECEPIATGVAPTWAMLFAFADLGDAVLNTDFIMSVTRDGLDYQVVTMSEAYYRFGGSSALVSGKVDISALDTGTAGRWLWETANSKSPKLLAACIVLGNS